MPFKIRLGIPEVVTFWNDMNQKFDRGQLNAMDEKFFKKFIKALRFLSDNPRHNSLNSHEIPPLTENTALKFGNPI